ncbi:MAG TPA: acetyl-CoA C-acyltransferase [Clostridia bacterium]|nr:acetyl-CoA C-acyltransferase [Clostridia bacterium]
MANREVVVLSAVRSAVGGFGGSLKDMEPSELGAVVAKEAFARAGVDPKAVQFAAVGNCIPTDSRYAYVARVATVNAGMSTDSVAFAVNRLCGSAQQAVVNAAQAIMLGDADYAIGGGVEVMSRGAYLLPALRSGARMGDTKAIDAMVAVLTDPFGVGHMGITAENLCTKWGISREEQDAFALESQKRAAAAIADGRFKSQIVPITFETRKGTVVFDTDEHPRMTTMEALAKMKPAFKKEGGTVTANVWFPGKAPYLSEDFNDLCSPALYDAFGARHTARFLEHFQGGYIHHHAKGAHIHARIAKLPHLKLLEQSWDPNCSRPVDRLPELIEAHNGLPLMIRCHARDVYEHIGELTQGRVVIMLNVDDVAQGRETMRFIRKHSIL